MLRHIKPLLDIVSTVVAIASNKPTIKTKLLVAGEIREKYLNFPLAMHRNALKVGESAECAALGRHSNPAIDRHLKTGHHA